VSRNRVTGLPASSPFVRHAIHISSFHPTGHPDPLYVLPLGGLVILASSADVLAVLSAGDVSHLRQTLQLVESPPQPDDPDESETESRCEPVLLEERALLAELKRLSRAAPDLIADFKAGDLSIDDQETYAARLMHVAEVLMIHAAARKRVAE
jgi:hypothetical protein